MNLYHTHAATEALKRSRHSDRDALLLFQRGPRVQNLHREEIEFLLAHKIQDSSPHAPLDTRAVRAERDVVAPGVIRIQVQKNINTNMRTRCARNEPGKETA